MPRRFWAHMLLAAALLLFLNDHVLKGAGILPGVVTGKLSDVCGVFLLPILCARIFRVRSARWQAIVCAACAVAFALLKTTAPANALYVAILGPTLIDPTDLVALPAAVGAFFFLRLPEAPKPWRDRFGLALAAIGCMATSAQRPPIDPSQRQPPPMSVAQSEPCATVVATGLEPRGDEAIVHFTVKNTIASDCEVDLSIALTAKTSAPGTEVETRGSASLTLAAGTATEVSIPVRAAYPISCGGDPVVNWEVVETPTTGGGFRGPSSAHLGCWAPVTGANPIAP